MSKRESPVIGKFGQDLQKLIEETLAHKSKELEEKEKQLEEREKKVNHILECQDQVKEIIKLRVGNQTFLSDPLTLKSVKDSFFSGFNFNF